MFNGDYPNNFETDPNNAGQNTAADENEAGGVSGQNQMDVGGGQSGQNACEGAAGQEAQGGVREQNPEQNGYGSFQNRQDNYQYRNYYSDRYRGAQEQEGRDGGYRNQGGYGGQGYPENGYSGRGYSGSGYSGSGNDENGRPRQKRKKKTSAAKIVAAVALILVFVGFCGGISWLAVSSLQEQLTSAAPIQGDEAAETEAEEERPKQEEASQQDNANEQEGTAADGQIASAGTIRESGNVTAVVTDVTDVVEKVMPACVSITNNYTQQIQDFWGQTYSQDEEASGSGIIIGQNDAELLIVTNNHVVDGADSLHVQFINGENLEAQVKGTDSAVDLAVVAVKLEDLDENTKNAICIAQMGDSDNLKIGEPAIAIGNALGYGQSVTTGVISALNRTLEISETGTSNALIQTDAAINPGNSGGALLNINGEVVGINSSKIGASVVEGMGYAIPISTAKPIIEELMTHETKSRVADEERGYLGISCINVTSDLSEDFGMPEGIFVAQVYAGTGADKAGLVRGDIITEFDGTAVRSQEELTRQMGYYKAGETVEITIMQGSPVGYQAKTVQITLSSYDELNEASQQSQEDAGRRQLRP